MTIKLTLDFEDLSTSLFEASESVYSSECALQVANEFSKLGNKLCVFVVTSTLKNDRYKEALSILIHAGCDIGSHTHSHLRLDFLTYQKQLYELEKSKDILESITNRTINKFRAPGFFVNTHTFCALQKAEFKENWSLIGKSKYVNESLKFDELRNVLVPNLFGVPIGGGYLRCVSITSEQLFKVFVRNYITYVHPWEFYDFNSSASYSKYPRKFKVGSGEKYFRLWQNVTESL